MHDRRSKLSQAVDVLSFRRAAGAGLYLQEITRMLLKLVSNGFCGSGKGEKAAFAIAAPIEAAR
jgi:hypothetical protein